MMTLRFASRFFTVCFIILYCLGSASAYDPPSITVTEPNGTNDTIGEGDDFATLVLGDPWDCDQPSDFTPFLDNLIDPRFENSIFKGVSSDSEPSIVIHYQGNQGAQRIGKTGQNFPINTSKYTQLSVRMYLSQNVAFQLIWFFDDLNLVDPNKKFGQSEFIQGYSGWHTYLIDLTALAVRNPGEYMWQAFPQVYGLRIDPHNATGLRNVTIQIDWIRLCESSDAACQKQIRWNADNPNGNAVVALYADLDRNFSNGYHYRIASDLDANLEAYTWTPNFMPPNDYFIHGIIGENYPDIITNDPWDMDTGAMDCTAKNFSGVNFSGGVFKGTSTTTNPMIEFRLDPEYPINANRFKRISFRMQAQHANHYNVYWRRQGETAYHHTDIEPTASGWQTYTFNLGSHPQWAGKIDYFRLCPSWRSGEYLQIDWVTLTTLSDNTSNLPSRDESYSPGPLSINAIPIVHILDPDNLGNEDFAATVLKNPWDMHDSPDVASVLNLVNFYFSNGAFYGTSTNGDPAIWLLQNGSAIDTSRYKNAIFTHKTSGEWSIMLGSVARIFWRSAWETKDTCSYPIVLYPGHNGHHYSTDYFETYVLDLEEALLEPAGYWFFSTPWNASHPANFRIDPTEFPDPRVSGLKSLKLTADDESTGTFVIRWEDLDLDSNASLSLYYDTNASGFNGQPIVTGLNENGDDFYRWSTTTIPEGTYYVYAIISDAYNTSRRYATGPIHIISPEDHAPPFLSAHYPGPGSTGASPYSRIKVHVMDTGTGVKQNSIAMRINGSPVSPSVTGFPRDFKLVYDPPGSYNFGSLVQVTLEADDLSTPPHHLSAAYSFRITGSTDTDGDNLPDDWENAHGLDSGSPAGENGPDGDLDGDGISNADEYQQGTDPTSPSAIITGPGFGPANSSLVRAFDAQGHHLQTTDFLAYTDISGYGVNVACADIDQDGRDEIITGPGPGIEHSPQVRVFERNGSPRPALSFIAYSVMKYGVNVTGGDIDQDGRDEIITGPGPGAVFAPHVRGWSCDSGSVTVMHNISYFAYGTKKLGVNVGTGDVDGDGYREIITGAGPGAVFGPHVRGWNYDGAAIAAMHNISYLAYGTRKWGVNVSSGDVDRDGKEEIITGAGPGAVFGPHVRGWNYTLAGGIQAIGNINFFAYGTKKYGVTPACGDFDGDGCSEIVTAPGPGPMFGPQVRGWNYDGTQLTATSLNFFSYDKDLYRYGARVALGQIDY